MAKELEGILISAEYILPVYESQEAPWDES